MVTKVNEWYKLAKQLEELKKEEMKLRKEVCDEVFVSPREGVNNYDLGQFQGKDFILKGTFPIERKVNEEELTNLREEFEGMHINCDTVVTLKPALVKKEYDKLTEEQRNLFDSCLTIKPGSPSLKIVEKKKC